MQIRKRIYVIILLLVVWGCKKEKVKVNSCYPAEVEAILTNNCATSGCHVGNQPPENLNLETWNDLFKGSDFGSIVIPEYPDWSHLFQHMNTFADLGVQAEPRMPPSPEEALGRQDILAIKSWIESGAPNCEGELRWESRTQSNSGKLFSLCAGSDLVAIADVESNLVMEYLEVGQSSQIDEAPHFIKQSPDGMYVYITLINGGLLEKYRTDNYELVGRLDVGPDPALIEVSSDGKRLIVSHWNSTSGTPKLSLVNAENMTLINSLIGTSDLISKAHGMATTEDFKTLYVVANSGNYYVKFSITDTQVIPEDYILLGPDVSPPFAQPTGDYQPYHCFLSPDEKYFFVSCSKTDEVRVFDTSTDELISQIPTGSFPRLMTFDAGENKLYVACANEENFSEQGSLRGCVSVIDVSSLSWERNIYRLGHRPHGLDIDPVRRRLIVSSENIGGADPPHHVLEGSEGPPGKYNVVDLNTGTVLPDMETEIPEFPNALVIIP